MVPKFRQKLAGIVFLTANILNDNAFNEVSLSFIQQSDNSGNKFKTANLKNLRSV